MWATTKFILRSPPSFGTNSCRLNSEQNFQQNFQHENENIHKLRDSMRDLVSTAALAAGICASFRGWNLVCAESRARAKNAMSSIYWVCGKFSMPLARAAWCARHASTDFTCTAFAMSIVRANTPLAVPMDGQRCRGLRCPWMVTQRRALFIRCTIEH